LRIPSAVLVWSLLLWIQLSMLVFSFFSDTLSTFWLLSIFVLIFPACLAVLSGVMFLFLDWDRRSCGKETNKVIKLRKN
jgi:hypothetical protein